LYFKISPILTRVTVFSGVGWGMSLLWSLSLIRVGFNLQAVRDVVANHATLIHLFGRINFFL
jgi:hypothetical protein